MNKEVKEADKSHEWVTGMDLPWCKRCTIDKISAHIWGDDEWVKNPISCSKVGKEYVNKKK